ncbi:MAG: phage capsid protein [bacterium]|nr:phage capsid protein [bacterium]
MAEANYPGGAASIVNKVNADTFIPEIWSDEIIAAFQKNLKMAPLVKRLSMTGKKGDLIHVPKPIRGEANVKAANTVVTIQANVEQELTIAVDQHFEYSRFIEDIVEVQALTSLRQFYTEDAGYQLATQVDNSLINCATGFGDGTRTANPTSAADWTHSASWEFSATSIVPFDGTPAAAFNDEGFREAIKVMDDNNVPMDNRYLVIPPSARRDIMGIDRYVSSDFVGGKAVESGLIGNLYGVDVYVSSNAPTLDTDVRGCLFFHKDAIVLAEQMAVRSQTQYKQEYLSTLYTADTLYGVQTYRPEAGLVLAVKA